VPDGVKIIRAAQTPGARVPPKPGSVTVAFPLNSTESHGHIHLSVPLHLPVTATCEDISAQQLTEEIKPLWTMRIHLLLVHQLHLLVVIRQFEVSVSCVRVQGEFTGN